MCEGCWEEYGSPKILTKDTILAGALIKDSYEINGVGGNLHIVVSDWNLEDEDVKFCEDMILRKNGEEPIFPDENLLNVEKQLLPLLKKFSVDERASCLALACDYIKNKGRTPR